MNLAEFNGSDYTPKLDDARLGKQMLEIFSLMKDGNWRTLGDIERATGYPQASISAQLRHMRKAKFGGHKVDKHRKDGPASGLWEYKVEAKSWGLADLRQPTVGGPDE